MARGVDGRLIFIDDEDRRRFLMIMSQLRSETGCSYLAYCLMGNHFHLAIKVTGIPLSRILQRLLTRYSKTFNRRHGRNGHLFQERFKAILCVDDRYLIGLVRYIHMNPVRAGLVPHAGLWDWSSYQIYAGQKGSVPLGHETSLQTAIKAALDSGSETDFEPWPEQQSEAPELLRREPEERTAMEALARRMSTEFALPLDMLRGSSRRRDASLARKRLIDVAVEEGHSLSAVARWLGRAPATIHALLYGRVRCRKSRKPDTVKSRASAGSSNNS